MNLTGMHAPLTIHTASLCVTAAEFYQDMNEKIAAEIQAEQEHGRSKYGLGENDLSHDDSKHPLKWCQYIADHLERAEHDTPMCWRQRMVKIAGLAVSAVEAFDRKGKCRKCGKPTFGRVCAKCKGEA